MQTIRVGELCRLIGVLLIGSALFLCHTEASAGCEREVRRFLGGRLWNEPPADFAWSIRIYPREGLLKSRRLEVMNVDGVARWELGRVEVRAYGSAKEAGFFQSEFWSDRARGRDLVSERWVSSGAVFHSSRGEEWVVMSREEGGHVENVRGQAGESAIPASPMAAWKNWRSFRELRWLGEADFVGEGWWNGDRVLWYSERGGDAARVVAIAYETGFPRAYWGPEAWWVYDFLEAREVQMEPPAKVISFRRALGLQIRGALSDTARPF